MFQPNKGKVRRCSTYISPFEDSNSIPCKYLCHHCHPLPPHHHHHFDHDTHAQQASGGGAQQRTSGSWSLIGPSSNISPDILFLFKYIPSYTNICKWYIDIFHFKYICWCNSCCVTAFCRSADFVMYLKSFGCLLVKFWPSQFPGCFHNDENCNGEKCQHYQDECERDENENSKHYQLWILTWNWRWTSNPYLNSRIAQ